MSQGIQGVQGKRGKYRLSLAFSILALVVAIGSNGTQILNTRHETAQGKQAHAALCVFAADLQTRIINGRLFLLAHPDGIQGITAKTIKASIDAEQSTLDALDTHLTC